MKFLALAIVTLGLSLATPTDAQAQSPAYYAVTPVAPAVVGYSAQRRGIWGRRVVVRPLVAPVAVAPPVVVARPVVTTSYYAPVVPVRTYRVPYVTVYRY